MHASELPLSHLYVIPDDIRLLHLEALQYLAGTDERLTLHKATNALGRRDIHTIGEFLRISMADLQQIKRIGAIGEDLLLELMGRIVEMQSEFARKYRHEIIAAKAEKNNPPS